MRPEPEAAALECLIQRIDARLEPGAFDGKAEVLDPELKQSFIGPGGPGESSFRHGCEYRRLAVVARWGLPISQFFRPSSREAAII